MDHSKYTASISDYEVVACAAVKDNGKLVEGCAYTVPRRFPIPLKTTLVNIATQNAAHQRYAILMELLFCPKFSLEATQVDTTKPKIIRHSFAPGCVQLCHGRFPCGYSSKYVDCYLDILLHL